jgi:hypothetical protein
VTIVTAKSTARRLVTNGMARPPPAVQRGEGRVPRDVM